MGGGRSPAVEEDVGDAAAARSADSLPDFPTPEEAVRAAVKENRPELRDPKVQQVVRFIDPDPLDVRVQVNAPGFCRLYAAFGRVEGETVRWRSFGRELPCELNG